MIGAIALRPWRVFAAVTAIMACVVLIFFAGRWSDDDSVILAPETEWAQELAFLALGDHGKPYASQMRVIEAMEQVAATHRDISFVTFLGDNFYFDGVQSTDDTKWESIFENRFDTPYLRGMRFFAALGNHDARGSIQAQVEYGKKRLGSGRWRMDGRYYSRLFGHAKGKPLLRLTIIDTTVPHDAAQIVFAKKTLSMNDAWWHIVAGHHPMRSYGPHLDDPDVIGAFRELMTQAAISLYLCGHNHNIQVIDRPHEPLYVISGAGGRDIKVINRSPDEFLAFSYDDFGFVKVSLTSSLMTVEVFDTHARQIHETHRAQ